MTTTPHLELVQLFVCSDGPLTIEQARTRTLFIAEEPKTDVSVAATLFSRPADAAVVGGSPWTFTRENMFLPRPLPRLLIIILGARATLHRSVGRCTSRTQEGSDVVARCRFLGLTGRVSTHWDYMTLAEVVACTASAFSRTTSQPAERFYKPSLCLCQTASNLGVFTHAKQLLNTVLDHVGYPVKRP